MDEKDILEQIQSLVTHEHDLRSKAESGEIPHDQERAQLKQLEESLDQAWDLLRQRRARREYGQNPDDSETRPVDEVEKYLQ
jgi:hypothetical protein